MEETKKREKQVGQQWRAMCFFEVLVERVADPTRKGAVASEILEGLPERLRPAGEHERVYRRLLESSIWKMPA